MSPFLAMLLTVICCAVTTSAEVIIPTADTVATLEDELATLFGDRKLVAPTVRLAFHDCVGDACDGCLNLENESNAGLEEIFGIISDIYDEHVGSVTRADLIQLAAAIGMEKAAAASRRKCLKNGDDDCMPDEFEVERVWGREDCDASGETDEMHDFPEPTMDGTEMLAYFDEHFGLNQDEVVALLGAHTLGSAHKDNSGHKGKWTPGEAKDFDNHFYKFLDNLDDFTVENVAKAKKDDEDKKWQFDFKDANDTNVSFMLNTDMAMALDIDVDKLSGSACFAADTCERSDMADMVNTYAESAETWAGNFKNVWTKVNANGYDSLTTID